MCKYRIIFNIIYSHKYSQIQYAHASFHLFNAKYLSFLSINLMNGGTIGMGSLTPFISRDWEMCQNFFLLNFF